MTRAREQTRTSRDTFTRYRAVEHIAYRLLLSKGYHAVLCAGTTTPFDLVAWRCSGQHILVKAERSRNPIHNLTEVTTQYRGDIDALRAIALPSFAQRQLWVWHLHTGWRFFDIMAGGISEVADNV
jgi:hypothetical protein